jgi:hypothetical protein
LLTTPYQAKEFREAHPYVPPEERERRLKAKKEAEAAEANNTSSVSDILESLQLSMIFDCLGCNVGVHPVHKGENDRPHFNGWRASSPCQQ